MGGSSLMKFVWMYSLKNKKWTKTSCRFQGYKFAAVLTSNQRYIILLGGHRNSPEPDAYPNKTKTEKYGKISVMDLKSNNSNGWKIKESKIRLPQPGPCIAAKTDGMISKDELLVIGYIKELFQSKEFENIQLPPTYLMMMIAEKYSAEMIHWIHYDGSHRGIHLKDILSSL